MANKRAWMNSKRSAFLLVFAGWLGCQTSNDMVLQPDPPSAATEVNAMSASPKDKGGVEPVPQPDLPTASAGESSEAAGRNAEPNNVSNGANMVANGGRPSVAGQHGAGSGSGAAGQGTETPGVAGADGGPLLTTDPDCDFSGIWAAKQVTISEALTLPQSSNNWYYLEFAQSGDQITIIKHFDCGVEVLGSLRVQISRSTLESLSKQNLQIGRKGTLIKQGGGCKLTIARFWSVRGAEERFLPNATRDSSDSVNQVAVSNPLPTASMTNGAIDTEGDGKLGVAFQVSGIGTRNAVQRDWTEWFTAPGYEIAADTDWREDLSVRADFDNEEVVLDPSMGLLITGSTPQAGAQHVLRLHFLGRDATDSRAKAIIREDNVETCYAIQDALPAEQL
jgi:hypothetical protein